MRARALLIPSLVLLALSLTALRCNPIPTIVINSPTPLEDVSACDVQLSFELVGAFSGPPDVTLNLQPFPVTLTESPPGTFTATLGPGDGLTSNNLIIVKATRSSDGVELTQGVSFDYSPLASAFQITDPADLITGPLGHSRVGDYMLESCLARFVIQDAPQRDLYSVGQYGGNLIDAELKGHPGVDNFLEVTAMINVETVVNPNSVVIVNDGADGNPAVVRTCGPDDLLDFVNPSTQVTDLGLAFPGNLNDNDQPVEACTDFELAATDAHLKIDTTITNIDTPGGPTVEMLIGDWMNQGGELDVMQTPNPGVGAAISNTLGTMGFHGIGEAASVDYAFTNTPPTPGSYVVISGVTVILHSRQVLQALLGIVSGDMIDPGESVVMTRYFGVGDGTASTAVDLEVAIKGITHADLSGCVTVAGVPAPGAKVTVGTFDGTGAITALHTAFTTDATGCYAGAVPLTADPVTYGVVAGRRGTLYEGGAATPPPTLVSFASGAQEVVDFDLPATGELSVDVTDASGTALPARVSVVGFDPSPEIVFPGPSLPLFGGSTLALLNDPDDSLPFGLVEFVYTGADGNATFDLEPGSYQVFVSRGTEYSTYDAPITITASNNPRPSTPRSRGSSTRAASSPPTSTSTASAPRTRGSPTRSASKATRARAWTTSS